MERLDIVKLMRKDSSSLGLFNIVERSELKIVLLRPSVTEKCQSVFHLEEKENWYFLWYGSVSSLESESRHFVAIFEEFHSKMWHLLFEKSDFYSHREAEKCTWRLAT